MFIRILTIFDFFEFLYTRACHQNRTGTWVIFSKKYFENLQKSEIHEIAENHEKWGYEFGMLLPFIALGYVSKLFLG